MECNGKILVYQLDPEIKLNQRYFMHASGLQYADEEIIIIYQYEELIYLDYNFEVLNWRFIDLNKGFNIYKSNSAILADNRTEIINLGVI
jgi:hypothetical protein